MRVSSVSDRGQSETLGFTLLVGLTLLGVGAIVLIGGGALDDARHATQVQNAEHAVSQLDAEATLVALGHTEIRRVDLGRGSGGTLRIDPDAGWLRIRHLNYSGTDDATLYNGTLGSFTYEVGQSTVAYQGGGVWRSDGRGSAMVSPPEVHYRGTTLILPVVQVRGQGTGGGRSSVLVTDGKPMRTIYPNASKTYPNTTDTYQNPVRNGTVQLSVHSDYYRGWADYFRTRTEGKVTVHDSNETVTLELAAPGVTGDFRFPADGNSISLRGVSGGHALSNFTMTLAPDDLDAASFANMDWSLIAEGPGKRFEFNVKNSGGKPCGGGQDPSFDVTLSYESGGNTYAWKNDSAFVENGTGAFTYTCAGQPRLHLNLTGPTNLTYRSGPSPVTFSQHAADNNREFSHGDSASTNFLVNHYLALFDSSIDLRLRDAETGKKGNAAGSVDETDSIGYLDYDATGQVVTFLHVSENEVRLEFT